MIKTIMYSANFKEGKAKRFLIVLNFCHLIFEFVSNFDIRISNFLFISRHSQ